MRVSFLQKILCLPIRLFFSRLSVGGRTDLLELITRYSLQGLEIQDRLRILLGLDSRLYEMQGPAAKQYGGGVHTKHKHMRYYEFFTSNLQPGMKVLDIGSGNGLLDLKLAENVDGLEGVGLEMDPDNVAQARSSHSHPKIKYIQGDANQFEPDESFDVVILSNVLEHFPKRVELLKRLIQNTKAPVFLIRVPSFERDWRVPLKEELGIEYRLDPTHFVEYTIAQFNSEMMAAGLAVDSLSTQWGEIWSVLKVKRIL
ncbi:MAG: class I SAM-dependent methyltransferase [Chloroflexi bacterium]|nr:class I SAM-dependent methyltransferase [Chloroflexota bacterium]